MQNMRFDWRWLALIVAIAVIVAGPSIPWPILALTLGGGGAYLLFMGWKVWSGGSMGGGGGRSRVTYWRGQRIELPPEPRRSSLPSLSGILPALIYLLLGGALVLGALGIVIQQMG
jgi:hypothetical protein